MLVAIHHPDDFDPSVEGCAISEDIHALNREMIAVGVRVFVGGLAPAPCAKSLRAQPDGKVLITDGPYLETKEHVGGFWVLETSRASRRSKPHVDAYITVRTNLISTCQVHFGRRFSP